MLDSPFIPLQKLSEVSALSTGPLKIEVKGTISVVLYTEDRTLRTQPAVLHSCSIVLLIWKVSKQIRVSAAFQGHKGNHKHKSLLPAIPNPPPSKSNLAILQRLQYVIHFQNFIFIHFSPRIMVQNYSMWYQCVLQKATIYIKGNFRPVYIYLEMV